MTLLRRGEAERDRADLIDLARGSATTPHHANAPPTRLAGGAYAIRPYDSPSAFAGEG